MIDRNSPDVGGDCNSVDVDDCNSVDVGGFWGGRVFSRKGFFSL